LIATISTKGTAETLWDGRWPMRDPLRLSATLRAENWQQPVGQPIRLVKN